MIATLTGRVDSTLDGQVILDVAGVGFQIAVPTNLLIEIGTVTTLHTALIVREDAFQLYGFASREQLALFDALRSVTGVGPKTALNALSTLAPTVITQAVADESHQPFETVAGIGAKTAKLIVVTLAGRLKGATKASDTNETALLQALRNLGWSERIAAPVAAKVSATAKTSDLSDLIRSALAELSARK